MKKIIFFVAMAFISGSAVAGGPTLADVLTSKMAGTGWTVHWEPSERIDFGVEVQGVVPPVKDYPKFVKTMVTKYIPANKYGRAASVIRCDKAKQVVITREAEQYPPGLCLEVK